jgi:hypothetical protein
MRRSMTRPTRAALRLEWPGKAMLRITKRDGSVLQVSSWQAWRQTAALHMRRPCFACEGDGYQAWLVVGDANRGEHSRWFSDYCRSCRGVGYLTR